MLRDLANFFLLNKPRKLFAAIIIGLLLADLISSVLLDVNSQLPAQRPKTFLVLSLNLEKPFIEGINQKISYISKYDDATYTHREEEKAPKGLVLSTQ